MNQHDLKILKNLILKNNMGSAKQQSYINFLLFKLPITISLVVFFFGKNNYTQKQTFFSTIKADSIITKEITREPQLLGRWFSFTDNHNACKQIKKVYDKKNKKVYFSVIYRYLERDYEIVVNYLKDLTVKKDGLKYEFVSLPIYFPF